MKIAVVIPALNEEVMLPRTLRHTSSLSFDHIIVVDGGSTDRTRDLVESARLYMQREPQKTPGSSSLNPQSPGPRPSEPRRRGGSPASSLMPRLTLLDSAPGRAHQMNIGASASQEDALVFLHADTQLPLEAKSAIQNALMQPTCVGGRFDLRFDRDGGWAWLVSRFMNARSRWTGIATGDQGIFVRKSTFEHMRGFAEIPIMEDVEFTTRLKKTGRVAALRSHVTTSFRRWAVCGPLRTILLMWTLRFLFWVGVNPHRLARFYHAVR